MYISGHSHSAEDAVDKGGVYDFVVNVEAPVATSIQGVGVASTNVEATDIYTINGVKVNGTLNSLPKGVYVVNGKKIVVR
ncbi:MAG: hypothetical protein MR536_01785 [Prevotella sp.]|nr:hypothetical protein [Prevotella sp.]